LYSCNFLYGCQEIRGEAKKIFKKISIYSLKSQNLLNKKKKIPQVTKLGIG